MSNEKVHFNHYVSVSCFTWIHKALKTSQCGNRVIFLFPAKTFCFTSLKQGILFRSLQECIAGFVNCLRIFRFLSRSSDRENCDRRSWWFRVCGMLSCHMTRKRGG